MLEVNIVMTAVLAIYAVIVHISLIKLKIHVVKLLETIKKHDYDNMPEAWSKVVEHMTKWG